MFHNSFIVYIWGNTQFSFGLVQILDSFFTFQKILQFLIVLHIQFE